MPSFTLSRPDLVSSFRRMVSMPYPFASDGHDLFCVDVLQRLQRAIPEGLEKWRTHAGFFGVAIDGREAHGGKLIGPPLKSAILEAYYRFAPPPPAVAEWEVPVLKAVVTTLSDAWGEFERSFSVPHLDWYPSFASCKPPAALPTANKACLLRSLKFDALSLGSFQLAERMRRNFAPPPPKPASSPAPRPSHLPLDPQSRARLMETGKVAQTTNPRLAQLGIPAQSSPPAPSWGLPPPPGTPPPFGSGLPPAPPAIPPNPYVHAPQVFRTVAEGFYLLVGNWMSRQQVTGAMGSGPVPTATSGVRNGSVLPGAHLRG